MQPTILKKSLAELIGTFILVLLGPGTVVISLLLIQGWDPYNSFNVGITIEAWVAIGLAFAIAVMAAIYAFGHISGAHINPAVTIALWVTGRVPAKDVLPYIVSQLIGAFLGSLAIVIILGPRAVETGLGATAMFEGVSYGQAIFTEFLMGFILMLVIMGSAVDKRAPSGFAGIAIGLVVGGNIILTGNITGASMNPARTFGPYLMNSLGGGANLWAQFPIYVIGPVAGAIAAAVIYDYISDVKKLG